MMMMMMISSRPQDSKLLQPSTSRFLLFLFTFTLTTSGQLFQQSSPTFQHEQDRYEGQRAVHTTFESPEHKFIGDHVSLRYPTKNITGSILNYTVQDSAETQLSYGQILALAGDYYANWAYDRCPRQISDNESESQTQFFANTQLLEYPSNRFPWWTLDSLVFYINKQGKETGDVPNTTDTPQEYVETYNYQSFDNWGYNEQFWRVTNAGYLAIALCNFDHFGKDAIIAYKAGHSLALQAAIALRSVTDIDNVTATLDNIYFTEAFSGHFLTDLFSSGHVRTPRRLLHGGFSISSVLTHVYTLDPFPADRSSQAQHDEDCANGLWVRNARGDNWAMYGDKQLSLLKSKGNYDMVLKAVQAGVSELYTAYLTGTMPEEYEALTYAPILDMDEGSNFSPLFKENSRTGGVSVRSVPSLRNVNKYVDYNSSSLSFDDWTNLYDSITTTTPFKNMYPLNIPDFSPGASLTQIRQSNISHFVISRFGPITYEDGTESWNMLSQDIIDGGLDEEITWWSSQEISPGIYSLLGNALHSSYLVGIQDTADGVKILWSQQYREQFNCTQAEYGKWSNDSDELGLTIYCEEELYILLRFKSFMEPPTMAGFSIWNPNVISKMSTINDAAGHEVLVSAGLDSNTNTFKWNFTTWSDGYETQHVTSYEETAVDYPALTLLKFQTESSPTYIRLSYGTGHGSPGMLQIDILGITSDYKVTTISSKDYVITWNRQFERNYMKWFLAPINETQHEYSLVAYIDSNVNDNLLVLSFSYNPDTLSFDEPLRSLIMADTVGQNFNGDFFQHLIAAQTSWIDKKTGTKTEAGIVELLDYCGVLGARLVAPVGDQSVYQVVGQIPAIAGQTSYALGTTSWNGISRAVGYFFH